VKAPVAASCRTRLGGVLAIAVALAVPAAAAAQVQVRDLVVTLGGSVEGYAGNFSAVSNPLVDSTDHAIATVGELGVRGMLSLYERSGRSLDVLFDSGMRQTAAVGFQFQDYAPREWVGNVSARFQQRLGTWGSLQLRGGARERAVRDRPPPPLFLQPSYGTRQGSLSLVTRSLDGVSLDGTLDFESVNYETPSLLPQLDLLDRRSSGLEIGLRWGYTSTMRFYGGLRWTDYANQPSYDPADPYRRDHTIHAGVEWTYAGDVFAQMGLDGTLNRSNGKRPEYDALSFRLLITTPLPGDFSANLYALLTGKSYIAEVTYARLVPGEEADNASLAYLQLNRPIATNLDGGVRFGWTRAETDIGSAYYRRFGMSIQLNYRPMGG
jgi:hypothetical protein